ncbi:putative C2H2 finger domain protein [Aspergillus undulatus]|uniref:putative C2H2 finger domain protein n=1 Tax=Aspergillus undulatus TaxID=1810928 RepID=UPI003CCDA9BD
MSAVSPQFVQGDSTDRNYEPQLSNLYLSTALDPEEEEFQQSGIHLTPVEDRTSAWNSSTSPPEHPANHVSTPANNEGYGTSYSEFLSPADDWTSDISGHTSPADLMMPNAWPTSPAPAQNIQTSAPQQYASHPSSPQATMNPSQLLTPNLTNNPSPSSDTASARGHQASRSHHPPIPRLITTPDTLNPRQAPESLPAISPIVKVESYSRGDSPVRDSFSTNRRPSQSSVHLSPGGMSNASEEDLTMETDRHSVSRSADGAWVRNGLTGHSGLAPDARGDEYAPSPNEMESQRKLAERNADIWTWSEAVSEAHSEADDEYPPRGRPGHHVNRRRAKSTGDPSLHQQDYFSLKSPSQPAVPGPGLLLQETSEYSDDGTVSSDPVSVNETRFVQEGSEITPQEPRNTELDGQQSHEFLGSHPWRDAEVDAVPRTTQIQPASSTQAMVEFQRRARENDTLSRVATWGTRDLDAHSIRSFQQMNLSCDGKEKKHERRPSLLKYFPQKTSNLLKRQRQRTDLSTFGPVPEGEVQDAEIRPAPTRKDSFPRRKLSLGFSNKSSNYSIGGAVMATTRQVAAIGGKDSLNVVSPSSTSKPWNSIKVRGRSRSEVPSSAPGLFELMTSHGGPPVPNINYSEPTEDESAQQTKQDHDAAEDEDDDDNDEKGLVMDFPIPPNLPVPTLEGFRTQILQLNPRLEPGLIDRFAHEQVRRYKRLIEIKQNHAKDISRGKCKAGKACFALGGKARLLPPRASAQDADSHTQFQIPGRGEAEEGPDALGETTIAAAQFPPGVPLPPQQVTLLPAEFECMVCFSVKKFQKPSDWTKHIYEDVQPFTCTFPDCSDPKSFKRKADWVRHESERHRQLEWWECSFTDCRHKCYRKDNFVQHLVREHKLPEPKVKKSKNKSPSGKANGPITPERQEELNREHEINKLWDLVESCRYETTKSPREEPCRFCGNVCTNWKKLTVHLAKHMEQLAIPILGLVDERNFSLNNGTSTGNPDTRSEQLSITPEASDFAPRLNTGVGEGFGSSVNFAQTQYTNGHTAPVSESLAMPFNANASYIPATSMPMDTTTNQLNNFDGVSPYATHNGGLSGPNELVEDQSRLMAMHQHQNSVTYPPPFNAGPRLQISNQDLRLLPEYGNISMSPTEMQYDPHSAVYVSAPGDGHYNTYHGPMASGMQYNAGGYQGQGQ